MSGNVVDLPLELALIRWSVVHRNWHELSGAMPVLTAFLADGVRGASFWKSPALRVYWFTRSGLDGMKPILKS